MTASTYSDEITAVQRRIPTGPHGNPLLGNAGDMLKDSLGFLQAAARYGDVTKYRIAQLTWYQVNHPDGIERVLQENNHNYTKGELTTKIIRPVVGDSLFIIEGASWLSRRRLMQPAFHRQRIAAFGDLMIAETLATSERWERAARAGKPIDMMAEMTHLTSQIVTRALFSSSVNDESNTVAKAITVLLEHICYRFQVPFYPPPWVPTLRNHRYHTALHTLDAAVNEIIAHHRRSAETGDDLLSMLMEARDADTGEGMNDRQLRDEVITFFVAGHETTANALTWAWYLLSQHPDAEQRLHAELDEVLSGRTPTVDDLPALPYTRMVIDEAMRLYPPAWITNRQAIAEDEICGYHIPAGAIVVTSPYVIHHHTAFWEDPEKFDPERFSPERSKGRHHYAYFPFGGGPRQCIGKPFALMEAHLALATLAQRYSLRMATDRPVECEPLVTLRPRNGLPMVLQPLAPPRGKH